MTLAILAIVLLPLMAESALASRNERHQRAHGGIEPKGDVYAVMQWAYPGAFAAMLAEGALSGTSGGRLFVAGAIVFAIAKALKWWAIWSLGTCWTFRVIVVPGACLVRRGPYRFLRHPNYLAVLGELAGVMLMTGSWVAGPIGIVMFGMLMLKRIAVEQHALDAILREP